MRLHGCQLGLAALAIDMARRKELFDELQPLVTTFDDHPWAWAKQEEGNRTRRRPRAAAGRAYA